jgi:hypothetical protein
LRDINWPDRFPEVPLSWSRIRWSRPRSCASGLPFGRPQTRRWPAQIPSRPSAPCWWTGPKLERQQRRNSVWLHVRCLNSDRVAGTRLCRCHGWRSAVVGAIMRALSRFEPARSRRHIFEEKRRTFESQRARLLDGHHHSGLAECQMPETELKSDLGQLQPHRVVGQHHSSSSGAWPLRCTHRQRPEEH